MRDRPIIYRVRSSRFVRVLATLLWPFLVLVSTITFVAAIPLRFQQLRTITPDASLVTGQLNLESATALAGLGWNATSWAAVITGMEATAAALFLLIATVIFWRRNRDPAGFYFALALLTFGLISSPLSSALEESHQVWYVVSFLLRLMGLASLVVAFLRFPDGRYVPGWSRWVAFVWLGYLLMSVFLPSLRFTSSLIIVSSRQAALLAWAFSWLGLIVVLQVYRYRYHATMEQRQQTKWVVYGMVVSFGLTTLLLVPLVVLPSLREPSPLSMALRIVGVCGILLGEMFFGFTVAFAILRYRLYDIDLIINRTIVYATLTGALVLIYFITVVILQSFLPARSEVATVLSTLAVASAFAPLRRRIQTVIDRCFYRKKYNAALTLSRFAITARDEVDLAVISGALASAIVETVQPTYLALWLAPTRRRPAIHATTQR